MSTLKLVLASGSPRRQQLLQDAGYRYEVIVPSETAEGGFSSEESPAEVVTRLAYQKAADVAGRVSEGVVIGCDTVVKCSGRILGKPSNRTDARQMLALLRGREHRVWSGLCLWKRPEERSSTPGRYDPASNGCNW